MSVRERLSELDSRFTTLVTVWLSGILIGELLIVFALTTSREFSAISKPSDWVVAIVLGILALAIFVLALRNEYIGE